MRLYKRNVEVVIGDQSEARRIKGLMASFEVTKTSTSKPSDGWIKIYNLNESTETQLDERGKRIQIFAGYEGDLSLLFDGDVRKVERDRQELDRIFTVTLGGNVKKTTSAEFIKSYSGSVKVRDIVRDAVPTFNLDLGDVNVIPQDAVLKDFVWSGRTADALNRILEPLKISWYEDDGAINFSLRGAVRDEYAHLISAKTGLIGTPSVTDDGIKLVSLLNPKIRLDSKIQIQSSTLERAAQGDDKNMSAAARDGFYKVVKLVHRGDNRIGEYATEIIAKEIQ